MIESVFNRVFVDNLFIKSQAVALDCKEYLVKVIEATLVKRLVAKGFFIWWWFYLRLVIN